MMRSELNEMLTTAVLTIGIAWGIAAFLIGLGASFTFNEIDLVDSLLILIFGFLIILPAAITAVWKPKFSAILLTISFVLVEFAGVANDGLRGAYLAGKKFLPNLILACAYAYVASVRRDSSPRKVASRLI